jgi:multimeric flavodoxin WrbA
MKIIAINGSPRGKKSVTYLMVEEFLKGAEEAGANTSHIILSELKINNCIGCLSCWMKTPSKCIFEDDFKKTDCSDADLVVLASPVYTDNITALLKNFIDRGVYSANPKIEKSQNNESLHLSEKNKKIPKIMVISHCGYPEQTHFEVLKLYFRRYARNHRTELVAEIYRSGGPLLLSEKTDFQPKILYYKELLQQAGMEIAKNLKISENLQFELEKPLVSDEFYIESHNKVFSDVQA